MGYAEHHEDDHDLGIEGTRIFPALSQQRADSPHAAPAWHRGGGPYPGDSWHGPAAPGAGRYAGYGQYAGYQQHAGYGQVPSRDEEPDYPAGSPASSPLGQARVMRPRRERLGLGRQGPARVRPMRPDRWVIAGSSIVAIIAVIVGVATARAPGKTMPSPFAPATTQGAPAHPASNVPVTCATASR